mgnify:CR=1 FL=1
MRPTFIHCTLYSTYILEKSIFHYLFNGTQTAADFAAWPKKRKREFGKYVTAKILSMPGDPAYLARFKKQLQSVILGDGSPTDWATWSYNDINLDDLHRKEIFPYDEDSDQDKPDVKQRLQMLHDNPATAALYFFVRRMVVRKTMTEFGMPTSYRKWFMRKLENWFNQCLCIAQMIDMSSHAPIFIIRVNMFSFRTSLLICFVSIFDRPQLIPIIRAMRVDPVWVSRSWIGSWTWDLQEDIYVHQRYASWKWRTARESQTRWLWPPLVKH